MKNRYGVVAALALACSLILAGCGGKDSIPVKTVEGVIYEAVENQIHEAEADMGIKKVSLKKKADNLWSGSVSFVGPNGDWTNEISVSYADNVLTWKFDDDYEYQMAYEQPDTKSKSKSNSNGKTVDKWLKAVRNNDEEMFTLFDELTTSDIEYLTTNYAADRTKFSYELNETGDGVVIKGFNGDAGVYSTVIVPKFIEEVPVVGIKNVFILNQGVVDILTVILPNTVQTMVARYGNKLCKINFPESLREIGGLYETALSGDIVLPDNLELIHDQTFRMCTNISSVTFGKRLKKIGSEAFRGTSIRSVKLPDSVETIKNGAFWACKNLVEADLGNNLSVIPSTAFRECDSLTTLVLPQKLQTIEGFAFIGCISLSDIIIPDGMVDVKWNNAFSGCGNIKLAIRKKLQDLGYSGRF